MKQRSSSLGVLGRTASALLFCLLCGYLGMQAAYPFVQSGRLRRENDETERQVQGYRYRRQQVEREMKSFTTPEGIEEQGRRQGYLKAGEHRLRIPQN